MDELRLDISIYSCSTWGHLHAAAFSYLQMINCSFFFLFSFLDKCAEINCLTSKGLHTEVNHRTLPWNCYAYQERDMRVLDLRAYQQQLQQQLPE